LVSVLCAMHLKNMSRIIIQSARTRARAMSCSFLGHAATGRRTARSSAERDWVGC
jgi:hypothetical protein